MKRIDSSGGLLYVLVVTILAGLAANLFMSPTGREEIYQLDHITQGFTPEHEVRFEPSNPPPCDVTKRPEQTLADFTASDKESHGAIGRTSVLREGDPQSHINNVIRSVVCGGPNRGANRLVLAGILAALRGGSPHPDFNDNEWAYAADMLMTELWLPEYTTDIKCQIEKPGTKTVYGQRVGGKLKLAITTIHTQRRSCYVGLVFQSINIGSSSPQMIRLRLECFFQATTLSDSRGKQLWHVPARG